MKVVYASNKISQWLAAIGLVAAVAGIIASQPAIAAVNVGNPASVETKEQHNAKMKWWREARFGMFIHWGLYAVPAGAWNGKQYPELGEWLMNIAKIPVDDYAALANQFNPVEFNADEWVMAAKNAGMKYIVITSKHHDGFAMFHSKVSSYNIFDATPFKRDPIKELADACKRHGMRLGFYYSQAQDWHHPGGAAAGGSWDPAQKGSMDEYIKNIAMPQVREILSNYGKISILWWDTPVGMTHEQAVALASLTKLQPGIITNDRLGADIAGDLTTPEQWIPANGYDGRDWETCMTMNDTWGYKSFDNNWKSTESLIRNLIDCASKGGNYLLNVGPTADGVFPQPIVERLKGIGKWMSVNSESIYGSSAGPFRKQLGWGRCTRKGSKLYLHVFDWPVDGVLRVPISNSVKKAYLLANRSKSLKCTKVDDNIEISLPKTAPDKIASVIVLEIKGEPVVTNAVTRIKAGKPAVFLANDCNIHGSGIKTENVNGISNLGYWQNKDEYVDWTAMFEKGGVYDVSLEYALSPVCAGSKLVLECNGDKLDINPIPTSSWDEFTVKSFGQIKIADAGSQTITLRATAMPGKAVINIRSITFKPAN